VRERGRDRHAELREQERHGAVAAEPDAAAGVSNGHYPNAYVRGLRVLEKLGRRYRGMRQMRHSVASLLHRKEGTLAVAY